MKSWGMIGLLVLAAIDFSGSSGVALPQQVGTIRVQTTLIQVPVIVSASKGGPVPGLKAEDFQLYDDGDARPLAFFAASSEPIRIALVLDTSKSTVTALNAIRKAAAGFLEQLRPQDQAMIVAFDSEVQVVWPFSSDQKVLKQALKGIEIGPNVGTRMYDAVVQVADKFLRPAQGRKAMILLTDGQDYGSKATPNEMLHAVLDSGVVVYPLFYSIDQRELAKRLAGINLPRKAGPGVWEKEERAAAALLGRMAAESAGTFFHAETTDLKKTFALVAEELRLQYLLAFYPDPVRLDGATHSLKVVLSRPELVSRARLHYQIAKSP